MTSAGVVRWEGERMVARIGPVRSLIRRVGGVVLLGSGVTGLLGGAITLPILGPASVAGFLLAAFPTVAGAALLRGPWRETDVEVTERSVILRSRGTEVIDGAEIVAVAAMRNPNQALRIETERKEWILPAANISEADLEGLVLAIRGVQHAHGQAARDAEQAQRAHAEQIRKLTSRSETR